MAENSLINVGQALHGYNNGHKLLSSSADISDIDKRAMLNLSDYSGSGTEKGFLSYLTGYPLPSSKFYVFAKTWYADEMKRPGCVWTHSLLIDFTDLWTIKDMRILLSLFKRPKESTAYPSYAELLSITMPTRALNDELGQDFYDISCLLYDNPDVGLVLLGNSSTQYENEILQIWNWQWPRMKRSFTFSTGSVSLRRYENQPMDLQIFPSKRERSIQGTENEIIKIVELGKSSCTSQWLELYQKTELQELQNFMVKYGADIKGNKLGFVSLLKAYDLFQELNTISVNSIVVFFKNYFPEPSQAKTLKVDIINWYFNSKKKGKYQLIELLMSEEPFLGISWNFANIIRSLWQRQQLSQTELYALINKLIESDFESDIFLLMQEIDNAEFWVAIKLPEEYYSQLLDKRPELEKEKALWTLETEMQLIWFSALQKRNKTNWANVAIAMMNARSESFAEKVYSESGPKIIDVLLNWMLENDQPVQTNWQFIIRENKETFFISLSQFKKINLPLLQLSLEVLIPNDKMWKSMETKVIEDFLGLLGKNKIEPETTGIYLLFMTACYENNLADPEFVNKLVFQPLHDRLKNQIIHFNSWERFKWSMGRDLYGLIEQNYFSKIFHDRNFIPEWDRCEFLRRSLIVTFLKYHWDPLSIIEAVKDEDTFKKVINFCVDITEGYKAVKKLYKNLPLAKNIPAFYSKILKEALE